MVTIIGGYDLPIPSLAESPSSPRTLDTIQVTVPSDILKKIHILPGDGTIHEKVSKILEQAVLTNFYTSVRL